MSKVKVQGNPSGTGTLTIAAPNTNSDATINLPTVTGGEFIVSDASGNVGIGTSTPVGRFEIRSDANSAQQGYVRNVNAGSSAYSVLNIGNDSSGTAFRTLVGSSTATAFGGANSANLVNSLNSPMTFWTNNTERARIASDGAQSSVIPGGTTLYPEFKCRAWVNFNGSPTPATIRGSGNVSSVTKNSATDFIVNLAVAMPDANGAAFYDGQYGAFTTTYATPYGSNVWVQSASQIRCLWYGVAPENRYVTVFR